MSHNDSLYLLTTSGCSLCEKAKAELWPVLEALKLSLVEVDIVDSSQLLNRFSTQIPVVTAQDPVRSTEISSFLGWPFNQNQVFDWLSRQ